MNRHLPRRPSARACFIVFAVTSYVLLALTWIYFSDQLLARLPDKGSIVWLSTMKGALFVVVSAAMFLVALLSVPPTERSDAGLVGSDSFFGKRRNRWLQGMVYVFAIVVTLLTLMFRLSMSDNVAERPMMIVFMFPIILSALIGGVGPGLLATAIAVIGIDFAIEPHLHMLESDPVLQLQWLFLCGNGIAVSLLSGLLWRSIARQETSHHLLEAIVSGTSDAVFVKDLQGRYLMVNDAGAAFTGRSRKAILGLNDEALFDESSARQLREKDQAVLAAGRVQTHLEHLSFQGGQSLVFLVTKGPVFDRFGKSCGLFGISRDVTALQAKEEALRSSEASLRLVQWLAGLGSWEWYLQTDIHKWSEEVYLIFGLNPTLPPLRYPEVMQYFSEESRNQLAEAIERCLTEGTSYACDAEVVRPDGSTRWITARGDAMRGEQGEIVKLQGTVLDITERKQMALQLKASEERLQLVVDATSDGFWDWDLVTGEIYRSSRYFEVTGYAPEHDAGDLAAFQRLVHPDDLASVMASLESHLNGVTPQLEFTFRMVSGHGETKWILGRGRVVARDASGKPLRLVGSLSDISERKRTDDDLRFVLNEAGDAIWLMDHGLRVLFANPAACRMTGYQADNLMYMAFGDLLAADNQTAFAEHVSLLDQERYIRREWSLSCADGHHIVVELTTERMNDGRYMVFGRDLTEQKWAERALREREQQLERVIEGADQGYWDWNVQTDDFQGSDRWLRMMGYAPGEVDVSFEHWPDIIHPDDFAAIKATIKRHLAGDIGSVEAETRCRTKAGDWCWVLMRGKVVEWDGAGRPLMMSGTHTDITERKRLEQAQQLASVVFDNSYEGIIVADPDKVITKVNAAFTRITGFSAEEAVGQTPRILSSGQQGEQFYIDMWDSVQRRDFWRGEIWNKRKNGELYAELLSISAVRDSKGDIQHYIGIFSDISQLKAHEAELDRVANFDPLTGVPNRRLLSDRLNQSIVRATRSGKTCAVCFLDLDGFKAVNDQYGHEAGDQLLIGVTENLKAIMRADDTLARLGGDEFVLLLSDIDSPEECTLILERVLAAINTEVGYGDLVFRVSGSIGVSLYPDDNADPDTLLRHADQAMYQAKEAGKNRFQLFDPESDRKAQTRRRYMELLRVALDNNEFTLYYQPKVDLLNGTIIGAEALIRWQHPERGLVSPAEFLPHIYGSSLEVAFGEWVIKQAMAQLASWLTQQLTVCVSVNISANHLLTPPFGEYLQTVLNQYPTVLPSNLELEVLESAAIADVDQAIDVLLNCRKLGVHFALDDFGTGYSSLTYLRKLPVDTLKIDQSFVRDMLTDEDDLGIVEGVILLASVFNRQVIAEGVETLEHGSRLCQLGCHHAQGYGIAKPMPPELFPQWCAMWYNTKPWLSIKQFGSGMVG
ncbi:PAS domain S-box protein [Chitinivorax sp. B]|uniref:PAS domain S-box protein n=1 Tax=Chitinivorax sp. B TaxID=2502235 RepID=UPI001485919E|nr:PAS domain S-box protein [Chitinivorax sp. B]